MTAPMTSALAAKRWIHDAITATVAPLTDPLTNEPVEVAFNDFGKYLAKDRIAVGKLTKEQAPDTFVGGGGQYWMTENVSLEIELFVVRGDSDMLQTEYRAWDLYTAIDQALRADPSFGETVTVGYIKSAEAETGWVAPEQGGGIATALTFHVHIETKF